MNTKKTVRLYRFSDANTYTDNLTLEQAQKFQRQQGGGSITPMPPIPPLTKAKLEEKAQRQETDIVLDKSTSKRVDRQARSKLNL